MADLYVHVRMQKCCRDVLAHIDEKRAGVACVDQGPLAPLGEQPVDRASGSIPPRTAAAAAGTTTVEEAELADVVRDTCAKLCWRHAEVHAGRSETTEAQFWRRLAESV